MSYEKVQNITIKKDWTISVTSASSNVYPIYYTRNEIEGTEENLQLLLGDLMSGSLKFNFSSKSKVRLAFNRTIKYMKEKYNNLSTWDYYLINTSEEAFYNRDWVKKDIEAINEKLGKEITYEDAQEIKKDIFNYFIEQVEKTKKEKIDDKLFYCLLEEGYLYKLTKYGYQYSRYKASKFNEAQSLELETMFPKAKFERA